MRLQLDFRSQSRRCCLNIAAADSAKRQVTNTRSAPCWQRCEKSNDFGERDKKIGGVGVFCAVFPDHPEENVGLVQAVTNLRLVVQSS